MSAPQPRQDAADNPAWWHIAGEEFCRLLDAHGAAWRRRHAGKPDWRFLNNLALDGENLPPIAAAMGFDTACGYYPRKTVRWWPDTFGPVWMVADFAAELLIAIDLGSGAWRTPDNRFRGETLIDLGAWRWGCTFGKAGYRIGRLCGRAHVPVVRP